MRRSLLGGLVLSSVACSHAPPATEPAKVERRDEWLLALTSDLERVGGNDGFEGRVRVLHAGKPEIDRSFGETACLPLGTGRRLLAVLAVGVLVDEGKLDWNDGVERHLPTVKGTSFAKLTMANLLTNSAGLAPTTGETVEQRLDAAARLRLQASPGTRIDPGDERPWVLVERVVAQVSGAPFERFAQERVMAPAGMTGTSLGASPACPDSARGTTTVDDQFRLIDGLRSGKVVSPSTRAKLWEPRLPLGAGADVAYGFFVRSQGDRQAVGLSGEGATTAYELWLDPAGTDALVLLGRTQARTARSIRTALGEFYALPPAQPHGPPPARRSLVH